MPVAGVDVGSVAAKAVIFDPQSRSLLGKAVLPTGWNAREAGEKALAAACADAGGIAASRIVGAGYRRISLPFADKVVTESHLPRARCRPPLPRNGRCARHRRAGQQGHQYGLGRLGAGFSDERQVRGGRGPFSTGPFRHPRHGAGGTRRSRRTGKARRHFQHVRRIRGDGNHRPACAGRHPPISPPASSAPSPGVCGALPPAYPCAANARSRAGWRQALRSAGCFPKNSASRSTCPVSATRRSHRSGLDCRPHLNGFTTIP